MNQHSKPVAVDLFCGAGGLSLGLRRAGFIVAVASDMSQHSEQTYCGNQYGDTVFLRVDLSETSKRDLLNAGGLSTGDVDLVAGGPPCKGFSSANGHSRNSDNPHNKSVDHFFRLVAEIRPRAFLMENVMGLLWHDGGYLRHCKHYRTLSEIGYHIEFLQLNGLDFGLPQNRLRLFLVGLRGDKVTKKLKHPKPSYGPSRAHSYVTLGEAILGDVPLLGDGIGWQMCDYTSVPTSPYQSLIRGRAKKVHNHVATRNSDKVRERMSKVPVGGNWKDIPPEYLGITVMHSCLYKRLDPSKPSVTLGHFRKNMLIHPIESRGLTLREAARLQSFPDDYYFEGPIDHMQQQIADAVPPLLAQAVAKQVMKLFR